MQATCSSPGFVGASDNLDNCNTSSLAPHQSRPVSAAPDVAGDAGSVPLTTTPAGLAAGLRETSDGSARRCSSIPARAAQSRKPPGAPTERSSGGVKGGAAGFLWRDFYALYAVLLTLYSTSLCSRGPPTWRTSSFSGFLCSSSLTPPCFCPFQLDSKLGVIVCEMGIVNTPSVAWEAEAPRSPSVGLILS